MKKNKKPNTKTCESLFTSDGKMTVLRGTDADIYRALKWKIEDWGGLEGIVILFFCLLVIAYVALVGVHAFYLFPKIIFSASVLSAVLGIIGAFILPIIEIISLFLLWKIARTIFGIVSVLYKIDRNRERSHYIRLFKKISLARYSSRVNAAKIMLKII